MKRILIVGAGGQIGSELTTYLRKIYGNDNVVATDVRECKQLAESGPFEVMNALDANAMAEMVSRQKIDSIFNLVALLSAGGGGGRPGGGCRRSEAPDGMAGQYRCADEFAGGGPSV